MSSGEILPPWASTGKCTFSMYQSCFMLTVPSPISDRGMGLGMATVSHQHGDAGARLWQTDG